MVRTFAQELQPVVWVAAPAGAAVSAAPIVVAVRVAPMMARAAVFESVTVLHC